MKYLSFLAMTLLWIAILYGGFLIYGAAGHDDPHINFWFSHTLLEQGQLVNYNGDRVEQTTSLLIVLLTALFSKILQLDLVTAGYLVDIFSSFACCVVVTKLAQRYCRGLMLWPALLALSSTSLLLWSFGGMGAVLAAVVLLVAAVVWASFANAAQLYTHHYVSLVAITILLVIVRPEMPVIIVVASASLCVWFLRVREQCLRFLQIFSFSLVVSAVLFCWQKLYFDSWLPLPVLAKQTGAFATKLQSGFIYTLIYSVVNPVVALSLLLAPILLCFSWSRIICTEEIVRAQYTQMLVLLALIGVYAGFVLTAGGDWMHAGRFVVPMIPMAAMLLVMMVSRVVRRAWLAHGLLLCVFFASASFTKDIVAKQAHGIPAWVQYRLDDSHKNYGLFERYNQEHLRDLAVIDRLKEILPVLNQKLNRPVNLLSGQAGMVFFRLGEQLYGKVHFYDLRGLVEGAFTRCSYLERVARNPMGIGWSYAEFLSMLLEIKQHCGVDPPDVIYDINNPKESMEPIFARYGYVLVHREEGFILRNTIKTVPVNMLFAPNVIFVRKELLPLLDSPELRVIKYRDMPLVSRAEGRWFTRLLQGEE
ncbi:MAG: hypothetical protein R3E63_00195 [Pseudomonadales bacterium]